jgi:hypothetical protein
VELDHDVFRRFDAMVARRLRQQRWIMWIAGGVVLAAELAYVLVV